METVLRPTINMRDTTDIAKRIFLLIIHLPFVYNQISCHFKLPITTHVQAER